MPFVVGVRGCYYHTDHYAEECEQTRRAACLDGARYFDSRFAVAIHS